MRLTALCVFGTLLAFTSHSWTEADSGEGDFLDDKEFGPCAATLRPEGLCRQGQDENTCPYLFSLPPLTVHLPKQLKELEEVMKELQKLKDNVDQLRKMCTDCTVSQSKRECERQRERENDNLNEETDGHGEKKNWMNERNLEKLNKFRQECGTDKDEADINVEKKLEEDGDNDPEKRAILEEKEKKKWEAERENNKEAVKENQNPLIKVAEKDGESQTEWVKGKDKLGQAKVPTGGGKESRADIAKEKVVEKNNRETDTDKNKEKDRKGFLQVEPEETTNIKNRKKTQENYHHMKQDETKETEKNTQKEVDRASDGIKMSEEYDEHTDEEQEQHREERKREMEKRVKTEQNNEKSKQTESIGHTEKEKTIKEWVVQEEDRETGKEIKTNVKNAVQTIQRDGDGELASVKANERPDFVSISLAPQSNEAITFTSSLPPTPLSVTTFNVVTDSNYRTGYALSTRTQKPGVAEYPSPDAEAGFRTTSSPTADTINTLGGPGQQITSGTARFTSTASRRPAAGFNGRSPGSLTTATTTPSHNLYTTTFPGVYSHRINTKNLSSNTKTGLKPKHGENRKPGIKPEVPQKATNPKNNHKPDRKPDKTIKSGKELKHAEIPKPDQRALPDNITTDQNLKNDQIPNTDQVLTTDQNKLPNQTFNSHQRPMSPVQKPTSQRPVTLNTFGSSEIPIINVKNLQHPLKTNKTDKGKKTMKKTKSEKEKKLDQRPEPNQHFTPVQEPESVNFTSKPNQKPVTKLMGNDEVNPSPGPKIKQDSKPGQTLTPDQKPKQPERIPKIPKINQNVKPNISKLNQTHPELLVDRKPKHGQVPQTNQGFKTDQMPKLVPDKIPETKSNKTSKTRPPPRHRPPARPVLKPGATAVQSPKPAVQPKPSPKTKTDLDLPHISVTTSNSIQNSQTDMPPTSGPVNPAADVSHSPGDTEFSHSTMETATLGAETYNSLKPGSFPRGHPEGFTMSPNSRMTSDLRPQTAGQPSSTPSTRPNSGILSSFISSPEPTEPNLAYNTHSSSQAKELHKVQETSPSQTPDPDKITNPVPSPSVQTTTVSPDLLSTTPANSGPKPPDADFSTPSPHELRVRINQVPALLNNSLSPNGAPPERRPKEHPEDNQGGSRPVRTNVTTAQRDCSDHLLRGHTKSGVYQVTPDTRSKDSSVKVFCDMELLGGGWTLIQRRQDGSVSFNRTWAEYRSGFGELDGGEFWLGNNVIHLLTRDRDMVLRVELEDFAGVMEHAQYAQFRVAGERQRYRLTVGGYSGTAGDALRFSKTYDHNNRAFTTPDRDHDRYPSGNCGAYYSSGWWFDACMSANLNGRYHGEKYKGIRDGIFWGTWHNISTEYYPSNDRRSFKTVRMMVRPKGFAP